MRWSRSRIVARARTNATQLGHGGHGGQISGAGTSCVPHTASQVPVPLVMPVAMAVSVTAWAVSSRTQVTHITLTPAGALLGLVTSHHLRLVRGRGRGWRRLGPGREGWPGENGRRGAVPPSRSPDSLVTAGSAVRARLEIMLSSASDQRNDLDTTR
jgi:hypothetical protein